MQKAKLYVDFGFHPGKDRLPRECAMNGLCIITGKRGAAAFFEDVALENQYKFDERTSKKSAIIMQIRKTLANHETAIDDFKFYRNRILYEKAEFEHQIDDLFLATKRNV